MVNLSKVMTKIKKTKGIAALACGAALFASGLTTIGVGIGLTISQAKQPAYSSVIESIAELRDELNMPVHESDLYLEQDYENQKARISAKQEELARLERFSETYFSPYTKMGINLAWAGLMAPLGLILLMNGGSKYKQSQREREVEENP